MKRRSVFADKLRAFSFVFGDEDVAKQRGAWREWFCDRYNQALIANSSPFAGEVALDEASSGRGGAEQSNIKSDSQSASNCSRSLTRSPEYGRDRTGALGRSSSAIPPPSSLLLELGCFDGTFLAGIAARYAQFNFIGLDWKARPLYLGAEQIAPMRLANLALIRARAQDMTHYFSDGEINEIWLLQPEPCDRENERANRLMSERFLLDAHRLLANDGTFILKTDHLEYFRSTLDFLATDAMRGRFQIEIRSGDFWNDHAAQESIAQHPLAGEVTFYECRFVRRKQPIYFLKIKRI